MSILEVVYQYRAAYLAGLGVTLKLCALAWVCGLIGGTAAALLSQWWPRLVGWPTAMLSRVTEAVPILVLLFWLHYPAQTAIGVLVDPFVTTGALLALLNALAVFGILHTAIQHVPNELVEAARVCGVDRQRVFWRIEFPLALRSALGSLTTAQVNVLQLSIFGSLISVNELFRVSQQINAQIYRPVEVYSAIALFFLGICLPLNLLARQFARRLV